MQLSKMRVQGYKGHKDTTIEFNELTAIIGRNNAGKSSLLEALDMFFNDARPDEGDRTKNSESDPIRITCCFSDLPQEITLDTQHLTTFEHEYLLNREGKLEIIKDFGKTKAGDKIYIHAVHPQNSYLHFKNDELKKEATKLKIPETSYDKRINSSIRSVIYKKMKEEGSLDLSLREVQIDDKKEDTKKIWEYLQKQLPLFSLFKVDVANTDKDDAAQTPLKIALKEELAKQEAELKKIADEVTKNTKVITDAVVQQLKKLNPGLAKELENQIELSLNKKLDWIRAFDPGINTEEGIPFNKQGSGTRRLVLLSFMLAVAEGKRTEGRKSIYAIEEPETSQHPNHQKLLIKALHKLAYEQDTQIILTTHVPALAGEIACKDLRYIEVRPDKTRKIHAGGDDKEDINKKIAEALGVLPNDKVKLIIGVEGQHDVTFLKNVSEIYHRYDNQFPNLEILEQKKEILMVPLGGSTLEYFISKETFKALKKPEFYLFDNDSDNNKIEKAIENLRGRAQQDQLCKVYQTQKPCIEHYVPREIFIQAYNDKHTKTPDIDPDFDWETKGLVARLTKILKASGYEKDSGSGSLKIMICNNASALLTIEDLKRHQVFDEIGNWLTSIKDLLNEDNALLQKEAA